MTDIKTVEELLGTYRSKIAIVQQKLLDIENFEEEILSALCLPACVISDIPKTKTNKFSSVVENAVFQKPEMEKELITDILKLSKEIKKVEILMNMLKERDKFLIEKKYIENNTWNETGALFSRKYFYITERSMRRKCKKILYKFSILLAP